jgi:hypothetical protein
MWLFTNIGFFSVVEKPYDIEQGLISIRSRVRLDLEVLKTLYLPSMTEIIESDDADYRFRCRVNKRDFAEAVPELIMNINYENFKDEIFEVQGPERASLYSNIWGQAYELQSHRHDNQTDKFSIINRISVPFVSNHCIVVIDAKGRVLMNTSPERSVETAFIHLNARTLRHPQHDILAHVYQLTGVEGKMAIPCTISKYEPKNGWNYYIVPVERITGNNASGLLPLEWVPIKRAQDMVGPHDLALDLKYDSKFIRKIRSSFILNDRIFQ